MTDEEWNEFYMGDDGTMTYYIDMVERKFARSSTASFDRDTIYWIPLMICSRKLCLREDSDRKVATYNGNVYRN